VTAGTSAPKPGQVGEAVLTSQIRCFGVSDQTMVNERQPIPERFEPLPKADLLDSVQLLEPACLYGVEKFGVHVVEFVENRIQPGALSALGSVWVPELHASFYSNMCSIATTNKIRKSAFISSTGPSSWERWPLWSRSLSRRA
jgi:hypothetical protein